PQYVFFLACVREAIAEIPRLARPGARVANETPTLADFYARQAQRPDLVSLSLSDPSERSQLRVGDFIIAARGRRYFSNDAILTTLQQTTAPVIRINVGARPALEVYALDENTVSPVNG